MKRFFAIEWYEGAGIILLLGLWFLPFTQGLRSDIPAGLARAVGLLDVPPFFLGILVSGDPQQPSVTGAIIGFVLSFYLYWIILRAVVRGIRRLF